jgi:hypothetical protein
VMVRMSISKVVETVVCPRFSLGCYFPGIKKIL